MSQELIQGWRAVVDRPTLLREKPAECISVVKQN